MTPDILKFANLGKADVMELARDSLRYGALRRLTPTQFGALHAESLRSTHGFDELVDMLVVDMKTPMMKTKPIKDNPKAGPYQSHIRHEP